MKTLVVTGMGLLALSWSTLGAEESSLAWERLPDLPDKEGFAGAFAGIAKDPAQGKEFLVVAGGANFPNGRPWEKEKNPIKIYYDRVFTLELGAEKLEWQELGRETAQQRLPHPVGYGMSVSLPERGSCLFIGGKHEKALDEVWEVTIDAGGTVAITARAKLPVPLVEGVAGMVGTKVIVAGGATNKSGGGFETVQQVFVLDTSQEEWEWEKTSWPESESGVKARGRMYPVAGVRGDKFYLFGGRDHAASEDEAGNRFEGLDWLADCYELDTTTKQWKRLADMPEARSAAPAMAVSAGVSHLLYLGGVPVPFLREQVAARPALNGQGHEHPGFPNSILAYDTITNTWAPAGSLPREVNFNYETKADPRTWATVTTPVVFWGEKVLIPTGEIKPGVRSPQVLMGEIKEERASLGLLNWIVIAVYLLGMVGIGYWFMKRKAAATTEAYFRGGQKIPYWVAGLSIFATVLSSITFMSIPARAYQTDITWYIGQLAMLLIVPIVAFCYLPFFRKLDLTSAYLYLERRFNLAVRLFGSLSFIILHIGRVAIVLYLPAVALAAVSNIDVDLAIILIGVLCVIYTVMGGIEAVVWTDAVQAIVLMGGAVLCLLLVLFNVEGGVGGVMEVAQTDAKLLQNLTMEFNMKDGTTTVYVLLVAFFFNSFLQYTSGQDVIQRYVTTKDVGSARKSLWLTMWMSVFGSIIFFLLGTALYAFYKSQPELLDPAMTKGDGILPFFIMQQLPAGVAGLIIAAVFAASQSSVSSSLNSVATAWTKDFDARLIRPNASDAHYLFSAKMVVVVTGVLGIGVATIMAHSNIENAFKTFLGIVGLSSGSLGGLFALGVFTKKANGTGALIGALVGIGAVATVKFSGAPVTGLLYAFIGFTSCFVVGYLASLIWGGSDEKGEGLSVHGC